MLTCFRKEDKKRKGQIWLVGRNYEAYFPTVKIKIKKMSGSCLIRLFIKKEEDWRTIRLTDLFIFIVFLSNKQKESDMAISS